MKKILLISNFVLAGIILFQACGPQNGKTSNQRASVNTDSCAVCLDYSNTTSTTAISPHIGHIISLNYRGNKGKKFVWKGENKTEDIDATSVWFGLEQIKRFIWTIEDTTCKRKCTGTFGVRIYYAQYPDPQTLGADSIYANPHYVGRHTVFLVPTFYDSESGKNVDWNLERGCGAEFDMGMDKVGSVLFAFGGRTSFDVENNGGVAPPPPNAGLFPTTRSSR